MKLKAHLLTTFCGSAKKVRVNVVFATLTLFCPLEYDTEFLSVFDVMKGNADKSVFTFTAARTVIVLLRGEEFVDGEFDSAECVTRVFGVARTFFCRNAEVISRNKQLNIAFKLNDCKQADCNGNCFFVLR